ncbi:MAG: hypothetical protein AAB971_02475 [Patescibacteria group bacterium]
MRSLFITCGVVVVGLRKVCGVVFGFYTTGLCCVFLVVDRLGAFYASLQGFVREFSQGTFDLFTSVKSLVLPPIHTTYNKEQLSYLNLVINT